MSYKSISLEILYFEVTGLFLMNDLVLFLKYWNFDIVIYLLAFKYQENNLRYR